MRHFDSTLPDRVALVVRKATAHLEPSMLEDQADGGKNLTPGNRKDIEIVREMIAKKMDVSVGEKLLKEKSNKVDTEMAIR